MTTQLLTVGEFQEAIWTINSQFSRLRGNDLDAESSGLDHRAPREVSARQSTRKAEIVFDPTRHAGLSTRRFAFDHHGSQTFARTVDRGRKSGWTTTDDREIVERFGRASFESCVFGEIYE